MTQREALREMSKNSDHTAAWVCKQMGYASPSTLSHLFSRKNVTVDLLIEVADYFGYHLVLVPSRKNVHHIVLELDKTKERNDRGTKKENEA